MSVHRASYEAFIGPIPEGFDIDHTCHKPSECQAGDNCPHRRCGNPDHLEAVTKLENTERGGGVGMANRAKSHCGNGHLLSGDNVYWQYIKGRSKPKRCCRECGRAACLAWYYRKTADMVREAVGL